MFLLNELCLLIEKGSRFSLLYAVGPGIRTFRAPLSSQRFTASPSPRLVIAPDVPLSRIPSPTFEDVAPGRHLIGLLAALDRSTALRLPIAKVSGLKLFSYEQ
ncbi:hypothetical protein cu1991 [Corynebacterium urealyticum DSM 7109]|uniref:Uncharacterized protein n=1 Tax=Corynebacterium urealyticum (strain ATCC 43042 / DSM 7109) TaxID=504474 RepID=B1VJ01_CORU7|nr:hypothetical protein cu1991 [Corynebacterium urealyticum DSM 7109]